MNMNLSTPIAHAACASVSLPNGERAVLMIGGLVQENGFQNSMMQYTVSTKSWSEVSSATLQVPQAFGTTLFHDGKLLYFGGVKNESSFNLDTLLLDLESFLWTER